MSLEIGLNCLQTAHVSVFPDGGGVERRYYIQPKWALASFLAGICSQTYKTISSMAVLTADNKQWPSLLMTLYQWAEENHTEVYFVRWINDSNIRGEQMTSAFSVNSIIPANILQWLAEDNTIVVPTMTSAIAGFEYAPSENPISRLLGPVITRVIEEEMKRSPSNYGHLRIGMHLEPHLLDAMRRLVKNGHWLWNLTDGRARLWIGGEGVFIDWIPAAKDITMLLIKDGFGGIPRDPDTLAELLLNASLIIKNKGEGNYWKILLPTGEYKDSMILLKDGQLIFPQGFNLDQFKDIPLLVEKNIDARKSEISRTHTSPVTEAQSDEAILQESSETKKKPPSVVKETILDAPGANRLAQKVSESKKTENRSGDKILDRLSKDTNWIITQILKAHNELSDSQRIFWTDTGLAINYEELSSHGITPTTLMEEFMTNNWLWLDMAKPTRKIHPVAFEGEPTKSLILKTDIALALGFKGK